MQHIDLLKKNSYAVYHTDLAGWKENATAIKNFVFMICTHGSAVIEIDLVKHKIGRHSCVALHGNSIAKLISASSSFDVYLFECNPETVLSSTLGFSVETLEKIFCSPCDVMTDDNEVKMLTNFFDNLAIFSGLPEFGHNTDLYCGVIRCVFICILYSKMNLTNNTVTLKSNYSSSDSYFRDFMILIKNNCRTQHNVAFYANKLCITPKYLNEIIRKKAHITAKDIITRVIIAEIKRELLISGNSVQRIAYDFNFCDQSSLGKFFKKATGLSPVAFRNAL